MRLSAEDLNQIKVLFDRSVDDMVAGENFCAKVAKLINKDIEALLARTAKSETENHMLRKKIDDLEQQSRRLSLRVYGLSEEVNEDTENKLVNIFQEKLGVPITAESIDRCHRIGVIRAASVRKTARPVLVQFTSYKIRESVYRAKAKLKGTKLVLSEDLTNTRYELLKAARLKFGNRKAWSNDGKVFVICDDSKVVLGSLGDLNDLPSPLSTDQNVGNVSLA